MGQGIVEGGCLVPVRDFYESHVTERVVSGRVGRPVKCQYSFCLSGARAFLLAAVQVVGCFSIVAIAPNASVASIHNRMLLVFGLGESGTRLNHDFG